jgi:hypothetical protein
LSSQILLYLKKRVNINFKKLKKDSSKRVKSYYIKKMITHNNSLNISQLKCVPWLTRRTLHNAMDFATIMATRRSSCPPIQGPFALSLSGPLKKVLCTWGMLYKYKYTPQGK